jgi:hypothetical protein
VANPKKPPQIETILRRNKDKLLVFLQNFHNDKEGLFFLWPMWALPVLTCYFQMNSSATRSSSSSSRFKAYDLSRPLRPCTYYPHPYLYLARILYFTRIQYPSATLRQSIRCITPSTPPFVPASHFPPPRRYVVAAFLIILHCYH